MANFDCYVRIYLPLDANGRPKPLITVTTTS